MLLRLSALLATLVLTLGTVPAAPLPHGELARYAAEMHRLGRFNGVALVARGSDVFADAYGYANIARRTPNTLHTQFEIASLSKMFTAVAILKLRDQGALKLGDSICTYITPCPAAWQPVTIEHLLHHRGGLPDYENALEMESPQYYAFMTSPQSSKRILEREAALPLDFVPGTKFSYSNTGYIALGFIAERAARQPLAKFLRRTVFEPAGMRETGVLGVDAAANLATGYASADVTWAQRLPGFSLETAHPKPVPRLALTPPSGDAGIFSTAGDLLRWARIMLGDQPALVSPAERAEILTGIEGYGDGWMTGTSFGMTRFRHTGELPGFLSNISVYPDENTVVIVLDNVDTPMNALTRDLQAIALGRPYDLPFSGPMGTLTDEQQARLSGQYRSSDGNIWCVGVSSGMLEVAVKDRFTAGLLPFDATHFYMPLASGLATFAGSGAGASDTLNLRYDGIDHPAARTHDACPAGTRF